MFDRIFVYSLISLLFLMAASIDCFIYDEDGNVDNEAVAAEFARRMNAWKRKEDRVKRRLREAGFAQFEAVFQEEEEEVEAEDENQVLILTGKVNHRCIE